MNGTNISWYSINRDLKPENHAPIELKEALEIVDRYLARAGETFEYFEEAFSATTFGFARTEDAFIEISVNGPNQIAYKFEGPNPDVPWFLKPWKGVFQHEEELHSRGELVARVTEFFSFPFEQIRTRLDSTG